MRATTIIFIAAIIYKNKCEKLFIYYIIYIHDKCYKNINYEFNIFFLV